MEKQQFILNHKKKLIFFTILLLIYAAWKAYLHFVYPIYYPTITWQQKLTVEINTPNGVKNGYGVYEVKNEFFPDPLIQTSPRSRYQGYAAIVELEADKYLFIRQGNPRFRVENIFRDKSDLDPVANDVSGDHNISLRSFYREVVKYKPSRPVNMNNEHNERSIYGIYFPNLNDPISAVKVDLKNMEEVFGEGYSLKSIQLSIVEDELDFSRIEKILPWVTERQNIPTGNLSGTGGGSADGPVANQIQFRHLYQMNSNL